MYLFEWLAWRAITHPHEARSSDPDMHTNVGIYEEEIIKEEAQARLCASETPMSRGPVYQFNDIVLEMRCGLLEPHRGYVALFSITVIVVLSMTGYAAFISAEAIAKADRNDSEFSYLWYLASVFQAALAVGGSWLYLKYGLIVSRLEIFTSRHLLVRFNRKTQQVYLHRPGHCGGITVLPWPGISSSASDPEAPEISGLNVPLCLSWSTLTTGTLHPEAICVGRRGRNQSELRNEWEFIRRFMDDGPEGLPRPPLTSHFPWPTQAFTAQFEGISHTFLSANLAMKSGILLMAPAILVFGMCHWLSLLLCWKPRWPKIIKEAGLPGKPVPRLKTFADYPQHIQMSLEENAAMWAPRPGKRPEN